MKDQADILRARMLSRGTHAPAQVLAVASGKGGVGKSNITINFALSLCRSGKRVLVLDMDVGMGNVDILLGRTSTSSLPDLIHHRLTFQQIIEQGAGRPGICCRRIRYDRASRNERRGL